jgi:lipopolysaccharide transport system permease protein
MEIRIRPNKSLALVDFGELWGYRVLLSILVWRDFATRYKQTLLGPIWFLIQPILPALVFTVVFGQVAGMSTDGVPRFLFFLCNQVVWGYFSGNFTAISGSLLTNLNVFSKVYFPRLVVPLASVLSNLVTLGIQLGLFFVFCLYYRVAKPEAAAPQLSWAIIVLPLVVLHLAVMAMGFGLCMAALTAKYRDLQQISVVLLQVWMYGSAVMYPLSQMPQKYREIFSVNPATFAIESARFCLLGRATLSWQAGAWSIGVTLAMLLIGLRLFNQTARTFVDIA